MRRMLTVLAAGALLVAGAVGVAGPAAASPDDPLSGPKAIFWPQGAGGGPADAPSPSQYNDLLYHGGAVEHHPHVYITYWGTEWRDGFATGPNNAYTNRTAMNYVTTFFAHLGGSAWNGVQTQYCDGIALA